MQTAAPQVSKQVPGSNRSVGTAAPPDPRVTRVQPSPTRAWFCLPTCPGFLAKNNASHRLYVALGCKEKSARPNGSPYTNDGSLIHPVIPTASSSSCESSFLWLFSSQPWRMLDGDRWPAIGRGHPNKNQGIKSKHESCAPSSEVPDAVQIIPISP
jgi:hypothetical protein